MSSTIQLDHCPICGGHATPFLQGTFDLHYGIEGAWDYERCKDCRVVFLNPAPTAEFLAASYDDSYYSYQDYQPRKSWNTWLRKLIGYNHSITGDPKFIKPGRILDIGCGSGAFLYQMKQAGWQTHGVDISAKAAEHGNTKHGLNIQAGTLRSVSFPAGHFDYIRSNHSFEHLLDPRDTLQWIHHHLADDGLLFLGVPNIDGLQARLFGKYWWNLGPPVHPFNYSRGTLSRLLQEHGFEVMSSRTNSNFAGILGSLQMALNGRRGQRSDMGLVFTNPVGKVLSHWLAKLSDTASAGDCLEIVARKRTPAGAMHG